MGIHPSVGGYSQTGKTLFQEQPWFFLTFPLPSCSSVLLAGLRLRPHKQTRWQMHRGPIKMMLGRFFYSCFSSKWDFCSTSSAFIFIFIFTSFYFDQNSLHLDPRASYSGFLSQTGTRPTSNVGHNWSWHGCVWAALFSIDSPSWILKLHISIIYYTLYCLKMDDDVTEGWWLYF